MRLFRFEGGGPLDGDRDLPWDLGEQPPMLYQVNEAEELVASEAPHFEDTGYWLRYVPAADGTPRYLWFVGWPTQV